MNDHEGEVFARALRAVTPSMPDPDRSGGEIEQLARRRNTRRRSATGAGAALCVGLIGSIAYGVWPDHTSQPTREIRPATSPANSPANSSASAATPTAAINSTTVPPNTPYVNAKRLASFGLVLRPADTETPRVREEAILAERDWSRGQYPNARPVQALLRRVTDTQYGPALPDGSVVPKIDRQLVWVVIAPDSHVCSLGGPFRPHHEPEAIPCGRGTWITLIDASSGRELLALSF